MSYKLYTVSIIKMVDINDNTTGPDTNFKEKLICALKF